MTTELVSKIVATIAAVCFGSYFIVEVWIRNETESRLFVFAWAAIGILGIVGAFIVDIIWKVSK